MAKGEESLKEIIKFLVLYLENIKNLELAKEKLEMMFLLDIIEKAEKENNWTTLGEIADVYLGNVKKADFFYFLKPKSYVSIKLKEGFEYYKPLIAKMDFIIKQIGADVGGIKSLKVPKIKEEDIKSFKEMEKIKTYIDKLIKKNKNRYFVFDVKLRNRIMVFALEGFKKYSKLKEI